MFIGLVCIYPQRITSISMTKGMLFYAQTMTDLRIKVGNHLRVGEYLLFRRTGQRFTTLYTYEMKCSFGS